MPPLYPARPRIRLNLVRGQLTRREAGEETPVGPPRPLGRAAMEARIRQRQAPPGVTYLIRPVRLGEPTEGDG